MPGFSNWRVSNKSLNIIKLKQASGNSPWSPKIVRCIDCSLPATTVILHQMPPVLAAKRNKSRPFNPNGRIRKASRSIKALPLKYFNVKTTERFVFKRRDKRCLLLSPKSSLIPVFIHFSDIFPDQVQSTLSKCRDIIAACPRVLLLKPSVLNCSDRPLADNVVFDGPGKSVPTYCWERQGTLLRTLDIVQYKVSAVDRKRDLLPVERDLWSIVHPFLSSIRKFTEELNENAVALDDYDTVDDVLTALCSADKPWSISVGPAPSPAPAVGDRAHMLLYSPQVGVFTRRFPDASAMPLVTLPCRLQNGLQLFPSPDRILDYLESISDRIESQRTLELLRQARRKLPAETSSQANPAPSAAAASSHDAAANGDAAPELDTAAPPPPADAEEHADARRAATALREGPPAAGSAGPA
jgi:hypothetical protein